MIECTKYIPVNKKYCLGIANIYVDKWDLEIYGFSLFEKEGKQWVNLPSRAIEEKGETKYIPIFKIRDPENQKKFLKQIKDAILIKRNEEEWNTQQ